MCADFWTTVTDGTFNSSSLLQNGKTIWLGAGSEGLQFQLLLRGRLSPYVRIFQALCSETLTESAAQLNTLYPLIPTQLCLVASFKCCFSSFCCAPLRRVFPATSGVVMKALGPLPPPLSLSPGGHCWLQPPPGSLQGLSICYRGKELQMWLHKSQKEGNNHFPRPAGSALINAIQYPLAFIVHAPTRA